jgi:hypothetical protein
MSPFGGGPEPLDGRWVRKASAAMVSHSIGSGWT